MVKNQFLKSGSVLRIVVIQFGIFREGVRSIFDFFGETCNRLFLRSIFCRRLVGWSIDYPLQVSSMETSIGGVFLKHYIPQTKLIVIGRGFFVTAGVCGSPKGRKVRSYQRNALLGIKLNRQYKARHGIRQISAFANNVYHDGPIRIILETRDMRMK